MRLCPTCSEPLNLQSPYTQIAGGSVRVYCSESCKDSFGLAGEDDEIASAPAMRRRWLVLALVGCAVALLAWRTTRESRSGFAVNIPEQPSAVAPAPDAASVALESPAADVSPNDIYWTGELASDRWLHPLSGPTRRMPVRDSRVFGAERPGERPPECYRGHCGVDIGGEVWGEPVLAVHDGVVDRVVRGPNRDHGGLYVRLAHRDGTVFTQYFHLAAIPQWPRRGQRVRAGQVIGLVGQTGVKKSGPHLHFTISVKPEPGAREQFIDPEPLIALWPVSIPIYSHTMSIPSTHVVPGLPRRGAGTKKRKTKRRSLASRSKSKSKSKPKPAQKSERKATEPVVEPPTELERAQPQSSAAPESTREIADAGR